MLEQEEKRNLEVFNDMDNTKELTHISLCAGYGGIDLGLKRVFSNLRTVCFSEIEAYAVANLVAKMETGFLDAAPIWTDLKTFPWESFHGKVDIISGGFPCQPFSMAGQRKGDEDPRHLFPYIKRGIEIVRPAFVFLENVSGIISKRLGSDGEDEKGTSVLLHVLRQLERLDYQATAGIFSASECGAPHQRKRVFILACSNQTMGYTTVRHGKGTIRTNQERWNRLESMVRETGESSMPDAWPSFRGQDQKPWEPPRKLSDTNGINNKVSTKRINTSKQESECNSSRQSESTLGRGINGSSNWMDYGELCESVCNKGDELRMLGNGVVPSTAERAFRTLFKQIKKPHHAMSSQNKNSLKSM